jgi:HEAT repeat protein
MPHIREELARYAARPSGDAARLPLAILFRRYPEELEAAFSEFLHLVRGVEHQRLGDLAVEIGLVSRWEKRYRSRSTAKRKSAVELLAQVPHAVALRILALALSDHDQSIRIQASRAQVRSGGAPEVEKVFAFALTQPLLVRALLAEELRPHLQLLSGRAIPDSLGSGRRDQILGALDMIGAWRRGLALPSVSALLRNPDPEIRAKAWQVLPFVGTAADPAENISEAILDSMDSVSSAAAAAAGRMKLDFAIPVLTHRLRGEGERVVLAAARSLSQLGNNGLRVLEAEVVAGNGFSAAASLEVLEKTRIGRSDWSV